MRPQDNVEVFDIIHNGSMRGDLNIPVENATFDCETFAFSITTRSYGSQTIISEVMELENVVFSLSLDVRNPTSLIISFSGDWTIANFVINVGVQYTRETGILVIRARPSGGQSLNFVVLATQLVSLSLPDPFGRGLAFTPFEVVGEIAHNNSTTLVVSTTSDIAKIYLIYSRPSGMSAQRAIAVEFRNFPLSSLIQQVTELDISVVPLFGSLNTPSIGLTISTGEINGLPDGLFAASTLLSLNGNLIESGKIGYVSFDFSPVPIRVNLEGGLNFSPVRAGLNVHSLVSAIPGIDLNRVSLPLDISILLNVDVAAFTLSGGSVCIAVRYSDGIRFFGGSIVLDLANISLCLSSQRVQVEVRGVTRIGGTIFVLDLFLSNNDDYVIMAVGRELPVTNALTQFQAVLLPSELNSLLGSIPFIHFSIIEPRLTYPLSAFPQQVQIRGTPVVAGYDTVSMDAIIIRQSTTSMVVGFDVDGVNLADILQTVSGFNFSILLLNQELDVTLVISPVTLPSTRLHGERFQNIDIVRGVSVQAEMGLPPDCSADPFCAAAQFLLGENARLSLRGTVQSTTRFALFAGVNDLSLGGGLTISNAGLEVVADPLVTAGITDSIALTNPAIVLTSRLFLATSSVVIEMNLAGCYENAFGVRWLAICNLLGSTGFGPGAAITSFELGGEIRFGDASCASVPIKAAGFLGIDIDTPTHNYYYVQFTNATTVSSLLASLCTRITLPAALAQSGFRNGFFSSFSLLGQEITHAEISIPAGYRLSGTLNILGLEGSADVTIGLPEEISIMVSLPPLNIGNGLLQMFASESNRSSGPFLMATVVLVPSPSVNMVATGFVNVLGISAAASLTITSTHYEYRISGRMLNFFQASLFISASYGDISQASFQVRGSFESGLFNRMENEIEQGLQSSQCSH